MNKRKRIPWNKGLTAETSELVASYTEKLKMKTGNKNTRWGTKDSKATVKKRMASKKKTEAAKRENGYRFVPWNKGLTKETSKSVLKASKKQKGKVRTEEHKRKISESIRSGFKDGRRVWNKGRSGIYSDKTLSRMSDGSRKKFFRQMKEIGKIVTPFYSHKACDFFDLINKKYKLKGVHALNEQEYFVERFGYFVDYYCKELNLAIEWNDEKHYEGGRLTIKHLRRQDRIKRSLRCRFINIREKTFKENNVFERIENIIRHDRLRLVS